MYRQKNKQYGVGKKHPKSNPRKAALLTEGTLRSSFKINFKNNMSAAFKNTEKRELKICNPKPLTAAVVDNFSLKKDIKVKYLRTLSHKLIAFMLRRWVIQITCLDLFFSYFDLIVFKRHGTKVEHSNLPVQRGAILKN